MTAEILIRKADVVVTMNGERAEIAGGDVLIRGGVIAAVGQGLTTTGAVIEAAGGVVTDWAGAPAHHGGRVLAASHAEVHQAAMVALRG